MQNRWLFFWSSFLFEFFVALSKINESNGEIATILPEAATRSGVLGKKVFLELLLNSQENTCARVSFLIKLQAPGGYFCILHYFFVNSRIVISLCRQNITSSSIFLLLTEFEPPRRVNLLTYLEIAKFSRDKLSSFHIWGTS